MSRQPLLQVRGLKKYFPVERSIIGRPTKTVHAVDGIDFEVLEGETLGVVGESGCGKSTTARLLMHLIDPTAGTITFDGAPVENTRLSLRNYRRRVQMVFQDSYSSLNPRLTIEASIAFGPEVHGAPHKEALARTHDLLARVGLEPTRFAERYPHELSGGQRQRVNIARALALQPKLIILDEAVSALDKSVEAQVLNLLMDLKEEFGLTYVFISHDLNVVQFISDRVMVMYLGQIAEIGPSEAVFADPRHPYSAALLSSMPSIDPDNRTEEVPLAGDPPNPIDPPSGCRFHTRCAFAEAVCSLDAPALTPVESGPPTTLARGPHAAACHIAVPGSGHTRATPVAATAAE